MITPYTPSEETAKRYRTPTLMSLIDQPSATGMTAQADIASTTDTSGAKHEHALVGARRNDRFLEHELEEVRERLEDAPRSDHVGPAAQLHRAPDLALEIDERRGGEKQAHQQQQALQHVPQQRAEIALVHPIAKRGHGPAADQKPQRGDDHDNDDCDRAEDRAPGRRSGTGGRRAGHAWNRPTPPPRAERPAPEPNIRP